MTSPKIYHLYVQPQIKFFIFGILGFLMLVGLFLIFLGLFHPIKNGPPWFVGLFFLVVVTVNGYYYVLSMSHTIVVLENGQIEFISLLRRKSFAVGEIISIKPHGSQIGFLLIKTNAGKIRLLNQFDEFHDFIQRVKNTRPGIEIRGC